MDKREKVARAIAVLHTMPWGMLSKSRRNRFFAYSDAAIAALDCIRQEAQEYTLSEKQSLDYKNIKKQVLAEVREAANSTRYAGRGLDELLNDLLDSTVEAELYHIIVYNLLKEWSLDNYYITEDYYSNSLPTDFSWYTVIDSTVIRFSEDGKRLAVATPV